MTDPNGVLADDPRLGPLVAAHGPLELEPAADLYRRLVVSLSRQQVSMAAAAMLAADPADLQAVGLSAAKSKYVRAAARAFRDREWDHDYFTGMDDDAVRAELTEVRGIGPWTADMVLMFGLGREDVFPVGDLGIRKAMQALFDAELGRPEMRTRAAEWAPYRSYASLYLWRAVEDES